MSLWIRYLLAGFILLFFLGTPLLCLFLPVGYGLWVMNGYMILSLLLFFYLRFRGNHFS